MYPRPRRSDYDKQNLEDRWNLTDRVFFACGACHILAHAHLDSFPQKQGKAIWLKPYNGFTGNHIVVDLGDEIFDYHGYSKKDNFLKHTFKKARHYWPDWNADIIELPKDVLISESKSRKYEGLWLREPKQFLHDAMPRAHAFLERFDHH